ncbi:MAG: XRE family transcriptional regulator [Loigolactobacillus coryniformis]|uniref:XRE family transcriptional regulator n=1 Tax=Loigolactobacillus coryniformis TaxID=1610 RepID=UPI002647CE4D|nr:XRE family transcriptional regulator [Loigolactobacillus coryniformis]MDN5951062.1 XRE family transcriptional regulator [Loigolactobacillus coryniformis]MDN5954284.1 XRE family transcriptional regulator [Loigolactobacillus coryniformis]
MLEVANKKSLKDAFLKPRINLRRTRRAEELSTQFMANLIGLKNRRQYELKENGKASFHDYEMLIIARRLGKSVKFLFYSE